MKNGYWFGFDVSINFINRIIKFRMNISTIKLYIYIHILFIINISIVINYIYINISIINIPIVINYIYKIEILL